MSAAEGKRSIEVLGRRMAWTEAGEGQPVVFLHGNPTSSYLWREVIPHVVPLARCVAPDLIGMGDSEKLPSSGPGSYRFVEHRRYLDGFLESLRLDREVVFVAHDWGSALAFDWARRHPGAVAGIAYMEAIVRPLSWEEWPESARSIFQAMRSATGEKLVLSDNVFVERILPASIIRDLSSEELSEYRRPFREAGESRRPTLTWPRELPIEGEPADVVAIVSEYADWMATSEVPKLFVNAEPGSILAGPQRETCRSWPQQTEVTVPGIHFIQEDSPHQIGEAVHDWLRDVVRA